MNYYVCDTDQSRNSGVSNAFLRKILDYYRFTDEQMKQIFEAIELDDLSDNIHINKVKDRLSKAIADNEKIFICGDYDADGICATAMIVNFLRGKGNNCGYYIPNRLKDGYGLSANLVEQAKQKGYDLIITVDNGIKAYDALELAHVYNIDVIILDHHIIEDHLDHELMIHPDLLPSSYQGLCGAGVVLQLIKAFDQDEPIYDILAMVATIADMVEMFNANRLITIKGLQLLNTVGYLPITALLNSKDNINEDTIAYQTVPAINTVGRLADIANANVLVEYLLSSDPTTIFTTAKAILELNDKRKYMIKEADASGDQFYHLPNYDIYINDDYHEGIIGLLANRFMIEQSRPSLVGTSNDDTYKFSGRSISGFDIYDNLYRYQDLFINFGGHKQACGLTIAKDKLAQLITLLQDETKIISDDQRQQVIKVNKSDLIIPNIAILDQLRPYGTGIKKPLFLLEEQNIDSMFMIKNKYPKAKLTGASSDIEIISFKKDFIDRANMSTKKIVGHLTINEFRSKRTINFLVEDVLF